MSIFEIMLEYLETRNKELLVTKDIEIDTETLTVIVIDILTWLKLEKKRELWKAQGRPGKNKPLELNMKYPWCVKLCELVEQEEAFKEYFCIENSKFDFADNVSLEERSIIRAFVYENYNPTMHKYNRPS